jgi:hypothetical protein
MSRATRYAAGIVISLGLLRGQSWAQDTEIPTNLVDRNTQSRPLDAQFLALASISYASALYDGQTTVSALRRCSNGCYEANRLMSPFAGNGPKVYAYSVGLTSVSLVATYHLKKKGVRWWWVPMVTTTALHVAAGIHNQNMNRTPVVR